MYFIETAHAGVITDAPRLSNLGMNVLYFLLSLIGILAIIMMVVAGILYIVAAGDPIKMKKAKKAFSGAVMGVIMAGGGYIVIKTIGIFFK